MLQIVSWYLILLAFGWAAWPITSWLFKAFLDKGYAFTRALGLLLAGFFFWLFTCFGVLQNDTGGVLAGLVTVLAISIFLQLSQRSESYASLFSSARKSVVWVEALFLVSFLFLVWWRSANPDITGTEKPMELAFINAILRSPVFPPADPWLSGYSISYYYFGYILTSMLIRLSGVSSGVGFNLMVASVFSLAATGLYGLLFNVINSSGIKDMFGKEGKVSYVGPLLAPLFTLIISNAEGLFEFLYSRGLFWQKAADGSWFSPFWKWVDLQELQQYPAQALSWWPNRAGGIIWWRASRVLSDYSLTGNFQEIIDEFPFFSFLLADLHPHVLTIPFAVLALGFTLNYLLGGADGKLDLFGLSLPLSIKYLISVPVFIGGLAFLNTWDFPVYLGIFLLAVLLIQIRSFGWNSDRLWELVSMGLILGVLSILIYLPFFIGFKSQAGGIIPSFVFFTRGAHFWMMFATLLIPLLLLFIFLRHQTGVETRWKKGFLWSTIIVFGMWAVSFLLAAAALKLPDWGESLAFSPVPAVVALGEKMIEAGRLFASIQGVEGEPTGGVILEVLLRRWLAPGGWLTMLLLLGLSLSALIPFVFRFTKSKTKEAVSAATKSDGGLVFVLLLVGVGTMIVLVPEFIYLRDQFGWRMNTIFKFYYQTWLLWSIAASFAVLYLWRRLDGGWVWAARAGSLAAILIGLLYPMIGLYYTTQGFKPQDLQLDGNHHLLLYQVNDFDAMQWLNSSPYGVVAESVGGSYSAHARMSTQSGLPTVIGWTPHEGQWGRTFKEMGNRDGDISTLYQTSDWLEAKSILDQYNIRYIVIGDLERNTYTTESARLNEEKFSSNLPKVYQNDSVVIYEYTGSMHEIQ